MAIVDAEWWYVRRKLGGAVGSSVQVENEEWPGDYTRVPYIRQRVPVCGRGTTAQRRARAVWRRVTSAWKTLLSEEQRAAWNEAAEEWWLAWYDPEFQYRHQTGYEFFVSFNARVVGAGLPWFVDPDELGPWGPTCTPTVQRLSSTTIRVTVSPNNPAYSVLAVYYRGPKSPGCTDVVPNLWWWRESVPRGWRLVGYGPYETATPLDFELPVTWPLGRRMSFLAGWMDYTGRMPYDWIVESVVAT